MKIFLAIIGIAMLFIFLLIAKYVIMDFKVDKEIEKEFEEDERRFGKL